MGIKETPTNFRIYYKSMQEHYKSLKDEALVIKEDLISKIKNKYNNILNNIQIYKDNFGVDLNSYDEFVNNTYITGHLLRISKGMFINRSNNYELTAILYDLYNFAKTQKDLYDLNKDITKYEKLLNLSLKQYTEILRVYYTEVQKHLILEGEGYSFSNDIGWICINRCVIRKCKKMIDFAATRKREAELKKQGVRIYNKEEADWCRKNGIEYKAEDKRVFKNDEYCYEVPLIGCKLPNGTKLKLEITDYRHSSLRGKTNEELSKIANNNPKDICNLKIDMKTKLTLCDKADKILYTKFIRNENQESIAIRKANRKNR